MLTLDDDKELFEMTEKELKKPMTDKQVGAAYVLRWLRRSEESWLRVWYLQRSA